MSPRIDKERGLETEPEVWLVGFARCPSLTAGPVRPGGLRLRRDHQSTVSAIRWKAHRGWRSSKLEQVTAGLRRALIPVVLRAGDMRGCVPRDRGAEDGSPA